jgi:hypothetical protein
MYLFCRAPAISSLLCGTKISEIAQFAINSYARTPFAGSLMEIDAYKSTSIVARFSLVLAVFMVGYGPQIG